MKWDRWAAVVLSVIVLLGGLAVAVGNDSAQLSRCITEDTKEGTGVDVGGSLWPPGNRCTYHHPDGSTTSVVKPASLRTVLVVGALLLVALAGPLTIGALWRRWYERATTFR